MDEARWLKAIEIVIKTPKKHAKIRAIKEIKYCK